jgi:uncharacterized membrane protein
MKNWTRRIRGLGATGVVWGATWGAAGGVLARVPGFFSDLPFPLVFAPLGFATGTLCSGFVQLFEGRAEFLGMSSLRSAAWGAASGLLLTALFVIGASVRGASLWDEFMVFGPALATAGAVSAVGSLALAKWVESRRLSSQRH